MKRLTITQKGYDLEVDGNIIPAQFSGNIEIQFIKDEAYKDYIVSPSIKYDNTTNVLEYNNGIIKLPQQAFKKDGHIHLAFLLKSTISTEEVNTFPVELYVNESVGGVDILPNDEQSWVAKVVDAVDQIYQKEYKEPLEETTRKSIEATNAAKEETKKLVDVREDVESKLNTGEFIPNFRIGTVQTGATSKATITGAKKEPVLNLTIQKGDKGDTGLTGLKGDNGDTGPKGDKGDKGDGVLVPHIVTVLPATGETSDIYFLINGKDYITYMWAEKKWLVVGSGNVDLSDYYTKSQIDDKINYLKVYNTDSSESSLIKTLDKIYKDKIIGLGDYVPIEKTFYLNLRSENSSYNFMGLEKNVSYYVKMYQDIRRGDRGILFTFMRFAVESMSDVFLHVGQDSSYNLTETQHIVKSTHFISTDGVVTNDIINKAKYLLDFEDKTSASGPYVFPVLGVETYGSGVANTVLGAKRFPTIIRSGEDSQPKIVLGDVKVDDASAEYIVTSPTIQHEVVLTQSQYDALSSKDNATLYFIMEL